MLTYWLVGEKAGTHRHRGRGAHTSSNRPKSSLRNTNHHKLASERYKKEFASSLDSPKRLRFAADSPTSPSTIGVEITDETTPFAASKRNSCPNLKANFGPIMLKPVFSRSVERKLCYQPHRLSTTSLVEALTFSAHAKSTPTTPNGKLQQQCPISSPLSSTKRSRNDNPKIELSPPEDTPNDRWPLLDKKQLNESDRETSVWKDRPLCPRKILVETVAMPPSDDRERPVEILFEE